MRTTRHPVLPSFLLFFALAFFAPALARAQGESQVPATPIGPPDSAALTSGFRYDPQHIPLGWASPNELLVAHREQYGLADVRDLRCTETGIYAVPVDGGTSRIVMNGKAVCHAVHSSLGLALHPKANALAYIPLAPVEKSRFLLLQFSDGTSKPLPSLCDQGWDFLQPGAWSPRGERLAVVSGCGHPAGHGALFLVTAGVGASRRVAPPAHWDERDPTWAPDGRWLAFTQQGDMRGRTPDSIAIMDTLGLGRRVLTAGLSPAWSPNGLWIAFLREVDSSPFGPQLTVRIIRAEGGDEREVFRTPNQTMMSRGWGNYLEGQPSPPLLWSQDGQWILFSRSFDSGTTIWRLRLEDGQLDQVTATLQPEPVPSRPRHDGA